MILIIAEKPSLARNIVSAIGNMKRNDGFYSNNEYLVSWAFGHLFSLVDIEDYEENPPKEIRWKMDNLPCFPKKFKFNLKKDSNKQVDAGVMKQFNIRPEMMVREMVSEGYPETDVIDFIETYTPQQSYRDALYKYAYSK